MFNLPNGQWNGSQSCVEEICSLQAKEEAKVEVKVESTPAKAPCVGRGQLVLEGYLFYFISF